MSDKDKPVFEVQADVLPPPKCETDKPKPKTHYFGKDGLGKFRPSAKMRDAILEAVQRKQAGYQPEYKHVASKHLVNPGSLKRFVGLYHKGKIEMGAPQNVVEKRRVDIAAESEKTFRLLGEYEQLLNYSAAELLKKARKEIKQGNLLAFDQLGLPKVISELRKAREFRGVVEKGNFAALHELMELEERRKALQAGPQIVMTGPVTMTQNNLTQGAPGESATNEKLITGNTNGPANVALTLTGEQDQIRAMLAGISPET